MTSPLNGYDRYSPHRLCKSRQVVSCFLRKAVSIYGQRRHRGTRDSGVRAHMYSVVHRETSRQLDPVWTFYSLPSLGPSVDDICKTGRTTSRAQSLEACI